MRLAFRHKGLQAFAKTGSAAGITPSHAARLRQCLDQLAHARSLEDVGRDVHPMSVGSAFSGQWAMKVTAQWRIVFAVDGDTCRNIDYVNYH